MDFFKIILENGFTIIATVGAIGFIYSVWTWATKDIKLTDTHTDLIALIDRIKMLNTDLKNLNQKVNTIMHLGNKPKDKDSKEN